MPAAIRKTARRPTHRSSAGHRTKRSASMNNSSRQLDYSSMDASKACLGCETSRQPCRSASLQHPGNCRNNNAQTMVTIDYAPGPDAVSKVMVRRFVPIDSPIVTTCRDAQPALPPDCPDVAATRNFGSSKSTVSEMAMMVKPDGTGIFKGSLVPRNASTENDYKANLNLMSSKPNIEISPEQHRCQKAAAQQGKNRNDAPKAQPKEPCRAGAKMPLEIPMEQPVFHTRRPSKTLEKPSNVPRRPSKTPQETSDVHRMSSKTPEVPPKVHRRSSKTSEEPPRAQRRSSKTSEEPPDAQRRSSKTSEELPRARRRSSKMPKEPPNAQRRSSKTPEESDNVPRRSFKAPEGPQPKLQQEEIKSHRKLCNATEEEQPNVDCDSRLTSMRRDRRNSRVTFAREPEAASSNCCQPNAGSISKHEEIKRLDDGRDQEERKPESYAIYDFCNRKSQSGGRDDKCRSHEKVQVSNMPRASQGSWGKQVKASDKSAIQEHRIHPCANKTKREANMSEESMGILTEGFSSAGEVQSQVYNHRCIQTSPDKRSNMSATKMKQQKSGGCGGQGVQKLEDKASSDKLKHVCSEAAFIYKAELETFPDESEESNKDKYNTDTDSEGLVELELDSRTNDTDERTGASGSQSAREIKMQQEKEKCHPRAENSKRDKCSAAGQYRQNEDNWSKRQTIETQTESDRGSRSENPCQPERRKPADGSARQACSESRSEKPGQPERSKPTNRSEKRSCAETQKQPPNFPGSTAPEQQQNVESFDIPESCLEALRHDAELRKRHEAADKARSEAMQKLLTKRPDITSAPEEREKKKTHVQSQWKKETDAKPIEKAKAQTKTCPGGNNLKTCPGDNNPKTCPGDNNLKTCPGGNNPKTLPGDNNLKTCPGGNNPKTCPGDNNLKTCPGGNNPKTCPGDNNLKTCPGDNKLKICPGGNHPAEKSTGRKCNPDPPDTKWVREGNLLVKVSPGQPSSYKVLSRDAASGDIYSTEQSESSAWNVDELVPPPEESILDESTSSQLPRTAEDIGQAKAEDSDDPLIGNKKKCCC